MTDAIDRWWRAFQDAERYIDAMYDHGAEFDVVGFMDETLSKVHDDICWEYGPAIAKPGHRLVFSPESHHELDPLVRVLLARAPQLDRWEFYQYRLAEDVEQTGRVVYSRVGGDLQGALAKLTRGDANLIDVTFYLPNAPGDSQDARMAASVATEYLLGEYNFHYWVGGIDVEAERSGPGWLPLERFKTTFDALVSSMQDQLPSTPLHTVADSLKWFTYERDGADDRDPAGVSDIFVGSTCMRKALPAVFGRVPFVSDRFSRCGEEFGYLKIDFVDVERGDFIDKRTKLQDSFEPMLKETGAGSIWGGGAGRRYAYIFLALTDVQKAVEIIVDGLQQHDTPERSWLLFLDVRLRNEWIGLAPNTPPPPGFGAES